MTRTYRLRGASHRKRTTITAPCTRESNGISGDWNDFILFSLFSAHDTTPLRLNGHTPHTVFIHFTYANKNYERTFDCQACILWEFDGEYLLEEKM